VQLAQFERRPELPRKRFIVAHSGFSAAKSPDFTWKISLPHPYNPKILPPVLILPPLLRRK
jgi:hypothetical protein